jgi:hypothetical protein
MRVELIVRMDRALTEGRGGFTTRADFISWAAEQLLDEMEYKDAPPEPLALRMAAERAWDDRARADSARGSGAGAGPPPGHASRALASQLDFDAAGAPLRSLEDTALPSEARGAVAEDGIAQVDDELLLGLHNRDYPSIWAAHRLATYTRDEPIAWGEFLERATGEAWGFASRLQALERAGGGRRLLSLFPANPSKRQASERGFRSFAIGTVSRPHNGGAIPVSGPLFAWRACQLLRPVEKPRVGLTSEGWDLLERLSGLSLEMPHDPDLALVFFRHLRRHAPGDWRGFRHVLRVVSESPNREGLVAQFVAVSPSRTPATVSSVAQGYIARGREWGLIEPKQVDGRYWLTEFGRRQAEEVET